MLRRPRVFFALGIIVCGLAATRLESADGQQAPTHLVVVFKDGREQVIPVGDVARIEFRSGPAFNTPSVSIPSPRTSLAGVYTGRYQNTAGGEGSSRMEILEVRGSTVTGVWDGDRFTGQLSGNVLSFPMTGLANGCRDYQVKVEFGGNGRNAVINYDVTNRCGNPYRGQARLEKQ